MTQTSIRPKGNIKRLKRSRGQAKSRLDQLKRFERLSFANKLLDMRSELVRTHVSDVYGQDAESKLAQKNISQALDFNLHMYTSTTFYEKHLRSKSALEYLALIVDYDITYLIFDQICSSRKK